MQVGGGSGGGGDSADLRGRHRIQAELKKLEQEARFLEEELEELEKADKVSSALQEYVSPAEEMFLTAMERKADPLLPVSTGPVNQSWDRWFEGPQDLRRCKCWFL
ncbi:guanine nucleotide-binding protein subunit gamma 1 isoform X1 [Miscanthus floridulus]|uniref:guanine nucleotide-binding protein subunit gamma 1 isoform X1 n=1 Tax=Miscanthus floridulus TaxID=154761 RepID=UPI0034588460